MSKTPQEESPPMVQWCVYQVRIHSGLYKCFSEKEYKTMMVDVERELDQKTADLRAWIHALAPALVTLLVILIIFLLTWRVIFSKKY